MFARVAGFPTIKTLDGFDFGFAAGVPLAVKKTRFAIDSLLEWNGFELSVPRCAREVGGLERLTRARLLAKGRFLAQRPQRSSKPPHPWEKRSAN
jgi:hypothetical protein